MHLFIRLENDKKSSLKLLKYLWSDTYHQELKVSVKKGLIL
jgi:hypothetical protein